MEKIKETGQFLASKMKNKPQTGIILGSGLGGLVQHLEIEDEVPYSTIPNFPVSTVKGHRGSLIFGKMNGVDVIVFTAGIGENNIQLRRMVMDGFAYLGAKLDESKNNTRTEAIISADDSNVKIVVIPTDEEIVIARDTLAIVTGLAVE